jgi:hypothetical protein
MFRRKTAPAAPAPTVPVDVPEIDAPSRDLVLAILARSEASQAQRLASNPRLRVTQDNLR